MLKRFIATAVIGALLSLTGGTAAQAAPSWCDIMEKIGVRNVRECEEPTR